MTLDTHDHDRYAAGMTYVYPVVSRRSQGVSIGINLNPNNACNWRCIYCQVPGLNRGLGPKVDLERLERELMTMLGWILNGDFMATKVPEGSRRLNDIAFSGNGESTTSPDFGAAVALVLDLLKRFDLNQDPRDLGLKLVVISNGSRLGDAKVRAALADLAAQGGELWFKLDRASDAGLKEINGAGTTIAAHEERLRSAIQTIPTYIQSCQFRWQGQTPSPADLEAIRDLVARMKGQENFLGVLLYGLARQPMQEPEASELSALSAEELQEIAAIWAATGVPIQVHL